MLPLGPCLLASMLCHAQDAPAPAGSARAGEDAGPGVYVDRLIDPATLPPLPDESAQRYDDSGLPRSFMLEGTWGFTDVDGRQEEYGVAASGFWEAELWGSFSADGAIARSAEDGEYLVYGSLWQRGLHLDGGWVMDNGLGVVFTPTPELQRRQVRISLPAQPILGVVSQARTRDGLQLQAGAGLPGSYSPGRLSGFDTDEGHALALSASWSAAAAWQAAVSGISTRRVASPDDVAFYGPGEGDSVHGAARWIGQDAGAQLNVLATRRPSGDESGPDAAAGGRSTYGAWLDASTRSGWHQHDYGVFYLDPGLNWGGQLMNHDARGAYYGVGYQRMRWSWTASLDYLEPVAGMGRASTYASGTARYQVYSRLGLGASATARRASTDAWVARVFADHRNFMGITRYEFDWSDNDDGATAWQLQLSHSMPESLGRRLSATLRYGEAKRLEQQRDRLTSVVVYGSQELFARVSLDGTLRYSQSRGSQSQDGVGASIGANWRISPRWTLLATYDRSRTDFRDAFVLEPFPQPTLPRPDVEIQSLFVSVRYSFRAGRPSAVLGGSPGSPAGFITGSVFLDANGNGIRDAGEAGAANVTVVLNDRFSLRTDSQGNFSFPMVATGTYSLRVLPDNLPLPWSFDDAAGEVFVDVGVRQQVRIDFAAQR